MTQFADDSLTCLLYIACTVFTCDATMTWAPWSVSPGNYIGVSDDTAAWVEVADRCAQYGTVPPKKDVHVDITSPEFRDFMNGYCPNNTYCWLGDKDPLFGTCNAVAVGSNTVYKTDSDCTQDYFKYLCYGVPVTDTTEIESTTGSILESTPGSIIESTLGSTMESTTEYMSTTEVQTTSATSTEPAEVSTESMTSPKDSELNSSQGQNTTAIESTTQSTTEYPSGVRSTSVQINSESVTSTDVAVSTLTSPKKMVTTVTGDASQTANLTNDTTTNSNTVQRMPDIGNFSDLSWNQWTPWSACTTSCNGGQKLRLTLCAGKLECRYQLTSVSNITISYDIQWSPCNTQPCPIDGVWIAWQQWSDCSVTCEKGTRRRHRLCYGPINGGEPCKGNQYDTEFCTIIGRCPGIIREVVHEESFKESDARPSAIGVGVVSLAFVLVELSIILCLDITTILQQCHQKRRQERIPDRHDITPEKQ